MDDYRCLTLPLLKFSTESNQVFKLVLHNVWTAIDQYYYSRDFFQNWLDKLFKKVWLVFFKILNFRQKKILGLDHV